VKDVELDEFLVNEKPCDFLTSVNAMDEPYTSSIAKEIDTNYGHALGIKDNLSDFGLLRAENESKGQKTILSLTEDGEKVAEALENLYDVVQEVGENQ